MSERYGSVAAAPSHALAEQYAPMRTFCGSSDAIQPGFCQ
jgi:hypothetical protein